MSSQIALEASMRLTPAGVRHLFGVSQEQLEYFAGKGSLEFGPDGQVELKAVAHAILLESIELATSAKRARHEVMNAIRTILKCGAVLRDAFDQIGDNADGAKAMRRLLEEHVAAFARLSASIDAEWDPQPSDDAEQPHGVVLQ